MISSEKAISALTLITLTTIIGLSAFGSQPPTVPSEPPKTVDHVDLERYMGKWYEISSIPAYFSVGCTHGTANYTLNNDSTVKVFNQCQRLGFETEANGKAIVKDTKTNAKLEVSFYPGTGGAYWIVRLADDYSYVVVSDDVYKFLWVLSRTPKMDETLYKSIIADLTKDGFPVNSLKIAKQ